MTEKELSQYSVIEEDINDINFRIRKLQEKGAQVKTDKVKGSSKYFPYREVKFNVTGVGQDAYHRAQNYDMAQSWTRLISGKNIQEHDLFLLRHERLEHDYMYVEGMSYWDAHSKATKQYNYQESVKSIKRGRK